MFDYAARRDRLYERMEAEGVEAMFVAPSADLEYLTGVERQIPNFGEVSYAHGWVTGALLRPGVDPVFFFPRMYATFDLPHPPEGDVQIVNETDDGAAIVAAAFGGLGKRGTVAIGDRTWTEATLHIGQTVGFERLRTGSSLVNELRRVKDSEEIAAMERAITPVEKAMAAVTSLVVPGVAMAELVEAIEHELGRNGSRTASFATHMFTGITDSDYDSHGTTGWDRAPEGTAVMFDFGAVVDGYCSDFGRTVFIGEPTAQYLEAYDAMIAAYEAGRAAASAGTPAREVNAACRQPIEEAGFGEHFRHRMGHGIGMNVHERPFLSEEDETPLDPGMTFTDEPSIMIPGSFSVRIEDIIVCEQGGGRTLNSYPTGSVATPVGAGA